MIISGVTVTGIRVPPGLQVQVLDESGYTEMWQNDKSPDSPGRLENLKELVRSMEEFENLTGFLEHISLVMDRDSGDGHRDEERPGKDGRATGRQRPCDRLGFGHEPARWEEFRRCYREELDGHPDVAVLRENKLTVSFQGKPVDATSVDWNRESIHKYTFTQAGCQAHAIVRHADPRLLVVVPGRDCNRTAATGVIDGVVNQVGNGFMNLGITGVNPKRCLLPILARPDPAQVLPMLARQGQVLQHDLTPQAGQIHLALAHGGGMAGVGQSQ